MMVACRPTVLFAVIVLQWLLLTYVLYHRQVESSNSATMNVPSSLMTESLDAPQQTAVIVAKDGSSASDFPPQKWRGVAVTLALRAPKWFHRRYTTMLYNVLANTPKDWAVQVVVQPQWWKNEILHLHRGMRRLVESEPRIVITELPEKYWRMKPKQVMIQQWFWEQVVAERALVFSGNGVMCSHGIVDLDHFAGLDFVGVHSARSGEGGDGSTHSLRSRQAMLDAIDFANVPEDHMPPSSESTFFVSNMKKMNKEGKGPYKLAPTNETIYFGGGPNLITIQDPENNRKRIIRSDIEQYGPSLVLSGTGAGLDYDVRDALLSICPEWRLIFPSLHDPNCFGASPNAEKCAASICALKPDRPKQGC